MDKGIATKDITDWLNNKGLSYVCADRKAKREFNPELAKPIKTSAGTTIMAHIVEDKARPGLFKLNCHSKDREAKELAIIATSADKLEKEVRDLDFNLKKTFAANNINEVNIKIRRISAQNRIAAPYYIIRAIPSDSDPAIAIGVEFELKERLGSKIDLPGVCSLLTNNPNMTEEEILRTYVSLTTIENVYGCLKNELGLRSIHHQKEERVQNHFFLSILTYQVVNYIKTALEKEGIHDSWSAIRETAKWHAIMQSIVR
jgi:transposase